MSNFKEIIIVSGFLLVLLFNIAENRRLRKNPKSAYFPPKRTIWYDYVRTRKNWALHANATQKSTKDPTTGPLKALDGNTTNLMAGGSCAVTKPNHDVHFFVDLKRFIYVEDVVIVSSADCCEGKSVLVGIAISVSIPCPACGYDRYVAYCNGWFGALPVGAAKHVYCERPTLGMQVNIMRAGKPVMLALCEVEVYGMPYVEVDSSLNWARGLPAYQSSDDPDNWEKTAAMALDGDYQCSTKYGSFSMTGPDDTDPWWMADLQQMLIVIKIHIFNRQDCCSEVLKRFTVWTLFHPKDNEPGYCANSLFAFDREKWVKCVFYARGRYLKLIFKDALLPGQSLNLCEVEVQAYKYITDPEHHKSRDNSALKQQTDQSSSHGNRTSHLAVDGNTVNIWSGHTCSMTALSDNYPWWSVHLGGNMFVEAVVIYVPLLPVDTYSANWAVRKPAFQSSVFGLYNLGADKAVDGDYRCRVPKLTFTHTHPMDQYPWWMVDLEQIIMVNEVKLFNREDCCDYRLHDFFIEVMQSRTETAPALCHHQIPPLRSFAVFQCHRYIRGRYVRIRKQGPAEFFDVLALCEVEVKGYKIEDTKNWAWQMVASQSSTTLNMTADLAVDGNYNCTVGASFSHTHEHDLHPWWIVDLKQTLTVTEVVVYTPDSYVDTVNEADNLARGKPASQSSTYQTYDANKAVDGNRDGDFNRSSCSSTGVGDGLPWWMVDLHQMVIVNEVTIFNRQDNSLFRLHNFYIEVLKCPGETVESLCHHQREAVGKSATFVCSPPLKGRYVKIRKDNLTATDDVLTLCEVEVKGSKVVFAGGTPGNWAKSKPAFQSSTQNDLSPGLAVDGNHDSHLEDGFCSSTQAGDGQPWWMVDLQETILVTQVLMYNRNNSKLYGLHDFYVEVLQSPNDTSPYLCYHQTYRAFEFPVAHCIPPLTGRFVRIRKDNIKSADDTLVLCEVEVKGAKLDAIEVGTESKNWAKGMPAFQSSDGPGKPASLAADGNYNCGNNGSYSITSSGDKSPWWMVDLEKLILVSTVKIVYTPGCCGGQLLGYFFIEVMKSCDQKSAAVCHYQERPLNETTTFQCDPHMIGQYVRIRKRRSESGASTRNSLVLCEVEVQGVAIGQHLSEYVVEVLQSRYDDSPLSCTHKTLALDKSIIYWCNPAPRGRYVRIRKKGPVMSFDVIMLCEVEVKGLPTVTSSANSDNWALGMPATQSSTEWNKPASFAVDGNYSCGYDGSITHTKLGDQYPWWVVDLETTIMVTSVVLYNRVDCCSERLSNFAIEVFVCDEKSPALCHNQTTAVNKAISISCSPPVRGRHVKIKKYGPVVKTDVLTLCEVEVRGTKTDNGVCFTNWAVNRPASQSTTNADMAAGRAVDGNTVCDTGGSFSQTLESDRNPWWMVDLQSVINVTAVKLYNRLDCCRERLRNFVIEILNVTGDTKPELCYERNTSINLNGKFYCTSPLLGRYVRIRKPGPVPIKDFLSLCEVEVFGTKDVEGLGSDNWARGMPARQSSTSGMMVPGIAVDGDYTCDVGAPHMTCTRPSDNHPWWMVDLEKIILVTAVKVFNSNNTDLLGNFTIDILKFPKDKSPSICHKQDAPIKTNATIWCKPPAEGRYVRITKRQDRLTLCEVEVKGYKVGETDNWALGKPAYQSTQFTATRLPGHAVDGDYNCSTNDNNFTHTSVWDTAPWWLVDLERSILVTEVKVFNRQDCCFERLHDFYIEIMHTRADKSAFVCHHQIEAVGAFASFTCPKVKGRFVRIRKQPPVVKNDVLTLCEVEVKGEEVAGDVDNWAWRMPTYQSTTVNEHTQSSLAVDGNYNCVAAGSVSMTTDSDPSAFWVVNLEQVVLVREVKVTSRETLNNFSIEVLMSPHDDPPATCHHQATAVIDTVFFTCRPSLKGRLVRIRMMEPSQHGKIIALCEVEVIGTKIADTENLAWGMPTFQSSEMGGHGPGLAADGVFLCSSEKWAMETVLDDQHPWWMVDIQKTVKITAVKIYNHRPCDTCVEHLRDFTIKVMEERDGQPTVCHQQVREVNRSETFYCSPVRLGRYVKIQKRGPVARGDILALCEVEVYGNNTEEHAPNLAIWVDHHHECDKATKLLPPGDVKGFQCPWDTYGGTVTIMKSPAYQGDTLSLCEVEVYAFTEDRNWALGRDAYIGETIGNKTEWHLVRHVVDGDISNGYNTIGCPSYRASHPVSLKIEFSDTHIHVEKIIYLTAGGLQAPVTVKNVVITLEDTFYRYTDSDSCQPDRSEFDPGYAITVLCSGGLRLANQVTMTNDPQVRLFAVCEVEIYGNFSSFKKPLVQMP